MLREKIKKNVVHWYGRFERPISSLSLIGGFVFDALTLERIDKVWDNFWVLAHIIIVAIFMILVHSVKNESGDEANPSKAHFWFVNILQFFFGGLLSVFLVFYFRSADIFVSWPFLVVLALAFWANESLKRSYMRLTFQTSLFFLSLMATFIFLVPVLLHKIGTTIFIISGILSLVFMFLFLYIIAYVSREKFLKSRKMIFASIAGIFITMNIFYFTNLIPPIPLSLKDSGVYHLIQRDSYGFYNASYEDLGLFSFFYFFPDFHEQPGSTVYAYSAVFSPSSLNVTIVHQWQYFNDASEKWINSDRTLLPLIGGRDGGYRTFSVKNDLTSGKWRVNVETLGGQVIGTIRFNIVRVNNPSLIKIKKLE